MKKFLTLMLALLLVLSLCACGQSGQSASGESTADTTGASIENNAGATETSAAETTEATIPEGMVQYKVKVVDQDGNPVVGVMVQVCTDESCLIPVKTDDTGVATFAPAEEGEYHANFLPEVPAGYEADADVFYFADGETELTIELKTVAENGEN